jgi:hypothetical protein
MPSASIVTASSVNDGCATVDRIAWRRAWSME